MTREEIIATGRYKPKAHGGARPNSGPKPADIDLKRVVKLRSDGLSMAEIGRRFGVGPGVIQRALKRAQLQNTLDKE